MSSGSEESSPLSKGAQTALREFRAPHNQIEAENGLLAGREFLLKKFGPLRKVLTDVRQKLPNAWPPFGQKGPRIERLLRREGAEPNAVNPMPEGVVEHIYVRPELVLPNNEQVFIQARSRQPGRFREVYEPPPGLLKDLRHGARKIQAAVSNTIAGIHPDKFKLIYFTTDVVPIGKVSLSQLGERARPPVVSIRQPDSLHHWGYWADQHGEPTAITYSALNQKGDATEMVDINLKKGTVHVYKGQNESKQISIKGLSSGVYQVVNGRLIRAGTDQEEPIPFVDYLKKVTEDYPPLP